MREEKNVFFFFLKNFYINSLALFLAVSLSFSHALFQTLVVEKLLGARQHHVPPRVVALGRVGLYLQFQQNAIFH